NLEQMRRASQSGSSGGEGGQQDGEGDDDGDGESIGEEQMQLPAPEEFATPEEYRRALLEGMSGEIPEEYRNLNRRYYEELVRQ
ncbi:MAG: hypothetical protein ACOZNI_07470, partial [Myxococcota bacterium]